MILYRGTTPTLNFKFRYNLGDLNITAFYLTFTQSREVKLEKSMEELEISGDTVTVHLTQEETLKLEPNIAVYIQARIKVDEKAYATNIIRTSLNAILKEGVI